VGVIVPGDEWGVIPDKLTDSCRRGWSDCGRSRAVKAKAGRGSLAPLARPIYQSQARGPRPMYRALTTRVLHCKARILVQLLP
jgi:hypothetical protein